MGFLSFGSFAVCLPKGPFMPKATLRNPSFLIPMTLEAQHISPLNYCTSANGIFDDTTREQMTEAVDAFEKVCDEKTFAIFFHGGLVSKDRGMDGATRLLGPYAATASPTAGDGLTTETWGNAYPYFFVWESGLFETLQHNLPGIVGEAIFRRINDIVGLKAASVIDPANAVLGSEAMLSRMATLTLTVPANTQPALTQDDIIEVQRAIEDDPIINAEKRRIAESSRPVSLGLTESIGSPTRTVRTSDATLMSPEIVSAIATEEALREHAASQKLDAFWNPVAFGTLALGAGKVLARIVQRYAQKRNHNFHNTVVEEIFRQFYISNIGASVWAEMKRETAEAFGSDSGCVGSAMIEELLRLYESGERGLEARVTLLGHSTGAVYICNFLAAMNAALSAKPYAAKIKFDVVFMAAAVRADVFDRTVSDHGNLIRNFRSFGMHDDLEAAEILVQLDNPPNSTINAVLAQIYTSSLLYFIAGCLEDDDDDTPLVGTERFFTGTAPFIQGAFPSIDGVADFFNRYPNAVVHSDTSGLDPQPNLGLRCASHHHGGFPGENPENGNGGTLESVCYLLRTGAY